MEQGFVTDSTKTRTELHREWFHHYIDMWEYIHTIYGFDFPSFENYCRFYEYDGSTGYNATFNKRPFRTIYYLKNNKLITDYSGGMREPKGNWLFYYDYNYYKGKMVNISKRTINPNFLFDIRICGEPKNLYLQI